MDKNNVKHKENTADKLKVESNESQNNPLVCPGQCGACQQSFLHNDEMELHMKFFHQSAEHSQ